MTQFINRRVRRPIHRWNLFMHSLTFFHFSYNYEGNYENNPLSSIVFVNKKNVWPKIDHCIYPENSQLELHSRQSINVMATEFNVNPTSVLCNYIHRYFDLESTVRTIGWMYPCGFKCRISDRKQREIQKTSHHLCNLTGICGS